MPLNSYQENSAHSGLLSVEDVPFFFSDRPFRIEMEILLFSLPPVLMN